MHKNNRADITREFLQICQEHRLKVTPQRDAIYEELLNLNSHPTADAVYQIVKIDPKSLGPDTEVMRF